MDLNDQRNMPDSYDPEIHLDKGLRVRLVIYVIVALVLIATVILHIIYDHVNTYYPVLGIVVGILLGIFLSRIYKITWDEGVGKVISHMDIMGIIFLLAYFVFDYYRDELVEHFIHGPAVIATSFALLTGTMLGRVIGIRRKVKQVVVENL